LRLRRVLWRSAARYFFTIGKASQSLTNAIAYFILNLAFDAFNIETFVDHLPCDGVGAALVIGLRTCSAISAPVAPVRSSLSMMYLTSELPVPVAVSRLSINC
jgi:hypothetical protein